MQKGSSTQSGPTLTKYCEVCQRANRRRFGFLLKICMGKVRESNARLKPFLTRYSAIDWESSLQKPQVL